ncbi:hypothetical protein BH20ACT4_BH20ACT4_12230 [soil metagenome]
MTVDYIGEPYEDLSAMADDSNSVVAGRVTDVASLGQPNTKDDVEADEYVAVTIDVESVLAGDDVDSVVIGWLAYGTDAEGNRASEIVQNGVRVPRKGDDMLLFLVDADPRTARQPERGPDPGRVRGLARAAEPGPQS